MSPARRLENIKTLAAAIHRMAHSDAKTNADRIAAYAQAVQALAEMPTTFLRANKGEYQRLMTEASKMLDKPGGGTKTG